MLAVGIHHQGMGEAALLRRLRPREHGGAFARIARQHEHGQRRFGFRQLPHRPFAAVGAPVDHDQHRLPVAQYLGHDLAQPHPGIIGGQKHQMSGGWRHAETGKTVTPVGHGWQAAVSGSA